MLLILLLFRTLVFSSPTANERLQHAVDASINHRQGAIVVLDVDGGEILASYRLDVAARRLASPGSTVKPFTLMALLESGVVKPETSLMCPKVVRIGKHNLDCSHPPTPAELDPVMALAYSCNHFFTVMAGRLPFDALAREFSRVGFASVSGKWPSEIPGMVEQPQTRDSEQLMGVGEEGIKVTPLALAEAYRNLVRPLRDPKTVTPELQLVSKGLRAVVTAGTGHLASSKNVQVAGKTRTSDGHAWFAGFAPADHPEVVVVVFLERGTGGADAAPIAGKIFDRYYSPVTSAP